MTPLDKSRLISAVAARLRIPLSEDDPAFVLVELNRLVLDQAICDAMERIQGIEPRPASRLILDPQGASQFAALVADHLGKERAIPVQPPHDAVPTAAARCEATEAGQGSSRAWAAASVAAFALALCMLALGYRLGAARSCFP